MECPKCGSALPDGELICTACGVTIDEAEPKEPSFGQEVQQNITKSLWGIAARGFACLSIFLLPAPLAIFFGIMALQEIKKYPQRRGKISAWAGIICGSIGTLLLLMVILMVSFGQKQLTAFLFAHQTIFLLKNTAKDIASLLKLAYTFTFPVNTKKHKKTHVFTWAFLYRVHPATRQVQQRN